MRRSPRASVLLLLASVAVALAAGVSLLTAAPLGLRVFGLFAATACALAIPIVGWPPPRAPSRPRRVAPRWDAPPVDDEEYPQ